MAKRSNRNYSANRGYHYSNANPRLTLPVYRLSSVLPDLLRSIEDRRVFHPLHEFRAARSLSVRSQSRIVPSSVASKRLFNHGLSFAVPSKVLVCVRRQQRKEVMIARGGAGSRRPKRRTVYSGISCKG